MAEEAEARKDSETKNKIPVLLIAIGIAVSLAICKAGALITKYLGISGGSLPAITAVVVVLATIFPSQFAHLAPSGEAMALILMQVCEFFYYTSSSNSAEFRNSFNLEKKLKHYSIRFSLIVVVE